jgi:predicted DNA-binding protein (MmcQ/YjbR family)
MDIDDVRAVCAGLSAATVGYPFGPEVCVYKVAGKVFALAAEAPPWRVSLKCDPELARILRERYPAITPGYHLNKRHWNTIALDGTVPTDEIREMIDHSYTLIAGGLPKSVRASLISDL